VSERGRLPLVWRWPRLPRDRNRRRDLLRVLRQRESESRVLGGPDMPHGDTPWPGRPAVSGLRKYERDADGRWGRVIFFGFRRRRVRRRRSAHRRRIGARRVCGVGQSRCRSVSKRQPGGHNRRLHTGRVAVHTCNTQQSAYFSCQSRFTASTSCSRVPDQDTKCSASAPYGYACLSTLPAGCVQLPATGGATIACCPAFPAQ
jgi:hypothetical protein